ncbi:MAG: hypothetical protein GF401_09535 [Chitinivibrionales bacterium]|nr:hypothetical protein [Chitinivibrionales bacterium]
MQAKLTLKLDQNTINSAKEYAQHTHQSLSSIVENFFKTLTKKQRKDPENPAPIVSSLSGAIKGPRNRDIKKEYLHYLEKKYK